MMHKIAGSVVTCALVSVTGCGSHDAGHGGTTAAAPASVAISAITTDAVYVVNGGDSTIWRCPSAMLVLWSLQDTTGSSVKTGGQ